MVRVFGLTTGSLKKYSKSSRREHERLSATYESRLSFLLFNSGRAPTTTTSSFIPPPFDKLTTDLGQIGWLPFIVELKRTIVAFAQLFIIYCCTAQRRNPQTRASAAQGHQTKHEPSFLLYSPPASNDKTHGAAHPNAELSNWVILSSSLDYSLSPTRHSHLLNSSSFRLSKTHPLISLRSSVHVFIASVNWYYSSSSSSPSSISTAPPPLLAILLQVRSLQPHVSFQPVL